MEVSSNGFAKAYNMISDYADINWAAGFFDGEGTFSITKYHKNGKPCYSPRMRIGGCHKGAIDRFAKIMNIGAVTMEESPASNANFKQFRWSTSGQNAIDCAQRLREHLTVKRLECDVLLLWEGFANGRDKRLTDADIKYREGLHQMMKAARIEELVRVGP
jgi:hypothetical protein